MSLLRPLVTALVLAAGVQAAEPGVTRPGEVLLDRAERRAELAAMPAELVRELCHAGIERFETHQGMTTVHPADDDGADPRAWPFTWSLMTAAAQALAYDDPEARRGVILGLRRWARGDSMTAVQESIPNTWYTIDRVMLPVLIAWGMVRDHPDLDEDTAAEIEDWLREVMDFRETRPDFPDMPGVARNNHLYLRDSVDMAWGALTGDDALFRRGFRSFEVALEEMRADGSLPLEVQRGARALWYQRHAVASLVAIAEMAAVQGHDLWGLDRNGRSLHAAVGFLLDGLDDPTIVWPYARANVSPGPFANYRVQDLGFMRTRGHGRHYMAWVEAYRARFPQREESRRLAKALETHDPDHWPMIDEYVGGAASCFFASAEAASQ